MFVLHVDMKVKAGSQNAFEKAFHEIFQPAISRQEGFGGVSLLRPREEGQDYRLTIAFESQPLQQKWVATDLHQQVWPQIENHCAQYSIRYYESV